ncbi:hypothetical protein D910_08467 [Dendroctonus ponderosae]
MALLDSERKIDRREKPQTKVIIRRLPPTMSKDQFLTQVAPIPDYNYMYHVRGDMSMGENAFSRAYINFVCPEDVYPFKEKFDNYVFVDSRGHEYIAVVEFAPFQKIPKKRGKGKMDPKCNTIEADASFLEFVVNLNKPVEQDEKPEYTLQLGERDENKKKDKTTPLLEFIKNKRAQRLKIREVRREEREKKKKEFERRKEMGSRYFDEKPPSKPYVKKSHLKYSKNDSHKDLPEDKPTKQDDSCSDKSPPDKPKDKRLEERKERKELKLRFPKKDYSENRDFCRPKEEAKASQAKKIKKYSERREERKLEAQKAELLKKLEQQQSSKPDPPEAEENPKTPLNCHEKETTLAQDEAAAQDSETQQKDTSTDDKCESGSSSRRIRNKDRPTIPLYRPGMLSKRKQPDTEENCKEDDNEAKKE